MKYLAIAAFLLLSLQVAAQGRFASRHLEAVTTVQIAVRAAHFRPILSLSPPAAPPLSVKLPAFCAADMPFFCRIEHQWAKQLPVAVKFRLGSVEYVDWLEGK